MMQVMVLDGQGRSVALVPLERAVHLWFKQAARVVEWFKDKVLWMGPMHNERGFRIVQEWMLNEEGVHVRKNIVVIRCPAIIQVYGFVRNGKRSNPSPSTENVVAFYNHRCQNADCGHSFKDGKMLTKDHIVPQSKGGRDVWENVTCLCQPCNNKKGSKSLDEMGWTLLRAPERPRSKLEVQLAKIRNVPAEWLLRIEG